LRFSAYIVLAWGRGQRYIERRFGGPSFEPTLPEGAPETGKGRALLFSRTQKGRQLFLEVFSLSDGGPFGRRHEIANTDYARGGFSPGSVLSPCEVLCFSFPSNHL
jgi:hypothetical protein